MKLGTLLQAYPVLQKLAQFKLPIAKSYQVYRLCKEVDNQKDFFVEKQKSLVDEYCGELLENGQIKFENQEKMIDFQKEYNDLIELSVEIQNLPIKMNLSMFGDQFLSAAELMLLENIIEIEEEKE